MFQILAKERPVLQQVSLGNILQKSLGIYVPGERQKCGQGIKRTHKRRVDSDGVPSERVQKIDGFSLSAFRVSFTVIFLISGKYWLNADETELSS